MSHRAINPLVHGILNARRSDRQRRSLALSRRIPAVMDALEERILLAPAPLVTSIDRATPAGQYASATSVSYAVTFSQTVTGVDPTDFKVITGGSLQAQTPVAVSGSGSSYTVQLNGLSGSGDLQLDLIDDDSIMNGSNAPLGGTGVDNGSFLGQTYTIDQAGPVVTSIDGTAPRSVPPTPLPSPTPSPSTKPSLVSVPATSCSPPPARSPPASPR